MSQIHQLQPKRFFDDWRLDVSTSELFPDRAILRLYMPHNPKNTDSSIEGPREHIEHMANTLDQLLCELTGTKTEKVIIDGTSKPT